MAGAAADDSPITAAATDGTCHPQSVCADVRHTLVGVADVAWDDAQFGLPQGVHLCSGMLAVKADDGVMGAVDCASRMVSWVLLTVQAGW